MQFEGLELSIDVLDATVTCVPDDDLTELQLLHDLAQYVEKGIPLIEAVVDVQ